MSADPPAPLSNAPAERATATAGLGAVVGAMGIVFGDIATSPLYTLQECLSGPHGVPPLPANVLGCISLIVWSLLLVVTVKYVGVLMQADNRGEGGIMALLALVPRGSRERAAGVLGTTTVLVLVGASLLFGDGIITPAISVLSAVEGLRIAAPGLEAAIVPLTVIYVPFMNAFLAVSSIALVVLFQESGRLAAAFGLAVSGTMAVTSLAFYHVARTHFSWTRTRAMLVVAGFLIVDLGFLGANRLKFVDGGYVPAVVGAGFVVIMIVWARGRSLLRAHYAAQSEPTAAFLTQLRERIDGRLPGIGVVMTATGGSIPPVLLNVVRRFKTLHETVLLTTVTTEEIPHVVGDRVSVEPLGHGLYRVALRYGFMDQPHVHSALAGVVGTIEQGADPARMTYVLGHERVIPGEGGRMGYVAESIFAALSRNASNPSDFFELPAAQVVELGARVDL